MNLIWVIMENNYCRYHFYRNNFITYTYPEKTIKDAIEWNSVVGDLLRKRKLISF